MFDSLFNSPKIHPVVINNTEIFLAELTAGQLTETYLNDKLETPEKILRSMALSIRDENGDLPYNSAVGRKKLLELPGHAYLAIANAIKDINLSDANVDVQKKD